MCIYLITYYDKYSKQSCSKSISSHACYVTLQKTFLTSKFSYLLFSNPTHQTKTGTANRCDTTNSNPPGPIKLSSQSTAGDRLCCACYQAQHPVQKCQAKNHFDDPNQHVLTLLHPISLAGSNTEHQWSCFKKFFY